MRYGPSLNMAPWRSPPANASRARRPGAARRLAPAPAAALARRAARERLGGRAGQRHRPVRHRHGRARRPGAARARARPGRAAGSSTSACSSARTRTPTTTGWPARSSTRAGCELWMHPNHEHMTRAARGPRRGARARGSRSRASAACPRQALAALPEGAQAAGHRDRRGSSCPTATSCRASRSTTDLGALAGVRDAWARAVARDASTSPTAAC